MDEINKGGLFMKTVVDKANTRGYANHGWLKTHHTFSFANYYNPKRVHFGMLRVLNDDSVAPGEGFDTHPHKNMEVISIPLKGYLRHGDSIRNSEVITPGDIQVMSAGTGISIASSMIAVKSSWISSRSGCSRVRRIQHLIIRAMISALF